MALNKTQHTLDSTSPLPRDMRPPPTTPAAAPLWPPEEDEGRCGSPFLVSNAMRGDLNCRDPLVRVGVALEAIPCQIGAKRLAKRNTEITAQMVLFRKGAKKMASHGVPTLEAVAGAFPRCC